MGQLAVLAQPLAVVGGHRHRRPAVEAAAVELREDAPHLLVDRGDLAVVGAAGVARAPRPAAGCRGRGRRRGGPRGRTGARRPSPARRAPGPPPRAPAAPPPGRCRPSDRARSRRRRPRSRALQAEAVVEHEGADEGAGAVAGAGEQGGEGRACRPAGRPAPLLRRPWWGGSRPVSRLVWEGSVSGTADEALANRSPSPARRSSAGGHRLAVAVAAEVVGAHRVQGHQHEVRAGGGALLARAAADPESRPRARGEQGARRAPDGIRRSSFTQSKNCLTRSVPAKNNGILREGKGRGSAGPGAVAIGLSSTAQRRRHRDDQRLRRGPGTAQLAGAAGRQDSRLPRVPGPRAAARRGPDAARAPGLGARAAEGAAARPRPRLGGRRQDRRPQRFRPARPADRRAVPGDPLQRLWRQRTVRSGQDRRAGAPAALRVRPLGGERPGADRGGGRRPAGARRRRSGAGARPAAPGGPGARRQVAAARAGDQQRRAGRPGTGSSHGDA